MRYSPPLLLLITLTVSPCDAMVGSLDITRLPNCHQARLVQYAMRHHLDKSGIHYAIHSVKLVSVEKQIYHELPEKWTCKGVLAFEYNGLMIQQPFLYQIGWTKSVKRHIDFQATFLSE